MATSFRRQERCIGGDQVRSDYFIRSGSVLRGGGVKQRRGKAQLSLERILSVIVSRGGGCGEVVTEEEVVVVGRRSSERGGVDLNLEEIGGGDGEVCKSESTAVGGVELQSSGGVCFGGLGVEEMWLLDSSAVVDVISGGSYGEDSIAEEHSLGNDVGVGMRAVRDADGEGGYLGLLIEAAQLVA